MSGGDFGRSSVALEPSVGGPGPLLGPLGEGLAEKWPWPEREDDLASGSGPKVDHCVSCCVSGERTLHFGFTNRTKKQIKHRTKKQRKPKNTKNDSKQQETIKILHTLEFLLFFSALPLFFLSIP